MTKTASTKNKSSFLDQNLAGDWEYDWRRYIFNAFRIGSLWRYQFAWLVVFGLKELLEPIQVRLIIVPLPH